MGRTQALYRKPDAESGVSIRAQKAVIGALRQCEPDWCELEIDGHRGWIRKADLWGVEREEVFKQ